MLKRIVLGLLFSSLISFHAQVIAENGTDPEKEKQEFNTKREMVQSQKRKAQLLDDKDTVSLLENLDQYLEAQALCFRNKGTMEVDICMLSVLKKLAENGNYIAQHEMGNMYENGYDDVKMANEWYQKAFHNPTMPKVYQEEVLKDIKRMESKSQGENKNE